MSMSLLAPASAGADPVPTPTPTAGAQATTVSSATSGLAPIVVLMDVSGSMNEDDGAGTMKLQGAKSAVRDIVGGLSRSTVFGLWSFPTSGCTGGGYVTPPAPLSDRDSVITSIDAMTADGSTPTGNALRAVADDLTGRGYTAATIVLVSDGESTCGDPPCDVANALVSEGFDVTVPTIGFRTSAEGTEELSCVAAATGAKTYAAADSEQLGQQLEDLVKARLELTVRYDQNPMSGGSTKITATVTHTGGEPARDVRVSLTIAEADDPDVRRAGVPPIFRVGNIPQGATVERTWTIGTGVRGYEAAHVFTASAWGSNALRVVSEGEYTPRSPKYTKDELGGLFSQVSNETPLVVFGDSYSSGEGTGPGGYYGTPTGVPASCHRSQKTYLGTVFSQAQMKIVACSGAVTDDLTAPGKLSQIQEMNSFNIVPGAGVLTFGGNDIGFEGAVEMCISPVEALKGGCAVAGFLDTKIKDVYALRDKLVKTYARAWSAMNTPELREKRDGAYVPLLVLPYPKVTHEPSRGSCYQFDFLEVVVADELATTLNDVIERAVGMAQTEGYEVYYVTDVEDSVRPDHTLCEVGPMAYINGWLPFNERLAMPESVHPKASGYLAETDAIIRWAGTAKLFPPVVSDEKIEANLTAIRPPVEISWPTPVDVLKPTDDMLIVRGGAIAPQGSGYHPGSPVTFTLHSDPVVLGTLTADEEGGIDGALLIPADVTVGQHHIVVSGVSQDGEYLERELAVTVIEPTPMWVWAALVGGILALLGGFAFVTIGLVKRRSARVSTR